MDALKLFQEYMGTGLIVLWFLVSLLYLWLTEKRKYIRVMFLYVPLVLLLVFFNPLLAKIVSVRCSFVENSPVEKDMWG